MRDRIKDKVVVITGASSGLGEATARALAQGGAKLVLGARRMDRLQALAKELGLGETAAVKTDVTQYQQVISLVDHAVQTHGRIDVILNNAGLMPHSPLERAKVRDWDRTIDVNLKGVLYGISVVLPHMKAQRSGHIINVSSVAGHVVRPGSAVYAATKTAVRVISEGLRQEVKPYNIRTTVISPGAVATELPDRSLRSKDLASRGSRTPPRTLTDGESVGRFSLGEAAVKGILRWCLAILIALGCGFRRTVKPRSHNAVRRIPGLEGAVASLADPLVMRHVSAQSVAGSGLHSAAANGRAHRPNFSRVRADRDGINRGVFTMYEERSARTRS
jgi:NADP-dependent 3-hydroxy acid dehydrogenase YdfG